MDKLISAQRLREQVASILVAAGSLGPEAEQVAGNLVLANLSGHDSHGVGMVPRYVEAIQEQGLQPNASARVTLDTGTLLALDGQRGYGQIVGVQAMELAMARAKAHGSCIMTLGHTHHLGRIGHFAEMAVAEGLVALHFVNVLSRPVVAPWGGGDGRFGTNPCCIGIPLPEGADAAAGGTRGHFILDFATSRVAQGKMRVAHHKGEQVPEGYLIDAQGRPTTDPGVVVVPQSDGAGAGLFGALMTFGEHKGYGLAVACELLGGALSGGGTWHRPADTARAVYNGMLTVLIDPQRLGTAETFGADAQAFVDWLRHSPAGAGQAGVLIAGEPERRARQQREREGLPIDHGTWQDILQAGRKVGIHLEP